MIPDEMLSDSTYQAIASVFRAVFFLLYYWVFVFVVAKSVIFFNWKYLTNEQIDALKKIFNFSAQPS